MIRIGITGGFGSGKSAVAEFFEQAGYPVLHADPLAKELMATNPALKKRLKEIVGREAFLEDGTLNTAHIAALIFSDHEIKKDVEAAVHPAVIRAIESKFDTLERLNKTSIAFVEAALIYESRIESMFDYIIAVTAPLETRIARSIERDGITGNEARRRINAQYHEAYVNEKADFVVDNSGNIDRLHERLQFILHLLEALAIKGGK